jgi:histidinol-phosphatase (PHP family)
MEAMCKAAFSKGFESIGFSSHAPVPKKTGIKAPWHLPAEKLPEYIEEALKARERWEGKLKVYLGLEVDFIQDICGPADAEIQALPLDYIIGSVHYISSPKTGEFFSVDGFPEEFCPGLESFDNDGLALCKAYYEAYSAMVNAAGCDILAHPDLIKKNNEKFPFFSPEDPEYIKLLEKTADVIMQAQEKTASGGRLPVVEVNTGGLIRGYTAEPYPSLAIMRILRERNIPLTLNADAHAPEHLDGGYEAARELMRQAGYGGILIYKGRKNDMEAEIWHSETL